MLSCLFLVINIHQQDGSAFTLYYTDFSVPEFLEFVLSVLVKRHEATKEVHK